MKSGSLETDIYLWKIKNRLRYRGIYSKIGTLPCKELLKNNLHPMLLE
jgi:hypothetical protein